MSDASVERDYVLGTHEAELQRLGLQHRVWRPRALEGWKRAGIRPGQSVFDIGCGPGYATLDLADIVGEEGRVVAVDRSSRFLEALRGAIQGKPQVSVEEADLDADELPPLVADAVWARWVFAFVRQPRQLVRKIAGAVRRPGGSVVIHEYFHYATWRFTQPSEIFERFVGLVMLSWRENGGEPNVGRTLPGWLEEEGFRIDSLTPYIDVITPSSLIWEWPRAFVDVGVERLQSLGWMSASEAAATREEFRRLEATPHVRMITPAVLEIIGTKS